jgi:hypothetical protein
MLDVSTFSSEALGGLARQARAHDRDQADDA